MLHSCLDIFEARMPSKTVGHDFGLLHALDERTALYGWLTNTGVKFIVAVDMQGRLAVSPVAAKASILGLRNSDLLPVSALRISINMQITDRHHRLFKQFKQRIFDCSTILFTSLTSILGKLNLRRSGVLDLSRRLNELARLGTLALRRCDSLTEPTYTTT